MIEIKKYTDEEILKMKRVTCKIAGEYLGVYPMFVSMALRQERLPIGFATKNDNGSWSYHIIAERLVAYKNGKLTEILIDSVEDKLNTINENLQSLSRDLILLLKQNDK